MTFATATPAQRMKVRDEATKTAKMAQPWAQNGVTPTAAEDTALTTQLTALAVAVQAVGVSALPGIKIRARDIYVTGDSRTANGFSTVASPPQVVLESYGYGSMLGPETGGKVRVTHTRNGGVGGDTSTMWLARMPGIVAVGADVYVNLISINDRGSAAMTLAQTQANILAGLKLQADTGAAVVIVAEVPVSFLTGEQLSIHLAVRDWIKSYLPTLGYLVADPWPDMVDPTSATYSPLAGMLVDDRHPSPTGALIIAQHVARLLNGLFYTGLSLPNGSTGAWLTPNPNQTGTGGTLSSTANATGSLAANSTLTGSSWTGATVTASKAPSEHGGEWQVLALGGTPTAASPFLTYHQLVDLSGLAVGDVIRGLARLDYTGMQSAAGVSLELMVTKPSGVEYYKIADRYTTSFAVSSGRVRGVYETPQYVLDKTETEIRVRAVVYTQSNLALAGTLKIQGMTAQKIA
ncbi:putative SGNA/GDSL hydrolase family protein [Pseudomonas phage MR18]|nr:putative SGNA/GDSL hydrolase family protein [Pseudomonas phage MR18]